MCALAAPSTCSAASIDTNTSGWLPRMAPWCGTPRSDRDEELPEPAAASPGDMCAGASKLYTSAWANRKPERATLPPPLLWADEAEGGEAVTAVPPMLALSSSASDTAATTLLGEDDRAVN